MTLKFQTTAVRGASGGDKHTGAISFPIYQSATFKHPGLNESTGYDYSRLQNPTVEELEKTVALLENGKHGLAFSTGLAAINCIVHLFKAGDHVVISEDLYGGTFRLFNNIYRELGIESTFVDTRNLVAVKDAVKENTKGILIETPSNPSLRVTDIRGISEIAKENDLIFIVDNTFLTPYYQKPLDLGADLIIHSGTKYLGGHNDVLAGLIVAKNDRFIERLRYINMSTGATLGAFEAWLILRGIKTLHIRLDRAQENAITIAKWLKNQEEISDVYYVGLKEHEGYEINKSQSTGFGTTLSFRVKDKELVEKILGGVEVVSFAESLGGVDTLITYPFTQTHSEIPTDLRKRIGVDECLLRLSVGIENVEDILNDLKKAIKGE
ncbi:PLP-dependent aspartate aminotransferase family protein [Clostridium sp. SHJSY1]|uniref:trans-sulfuration enzyme family protein n=1 Tax=Clostridium sp. SHJSY1 TaxID=2942483 RepID=UPI0028743D76|nr:PLP-dependent aspartate aminotransferase family protein [Clostridium sp. SHJSY1]MDS0527180.1 PLP-dependent aspartate aminotransferase family protein [Clostridium sp. SHJSY1]